MKYDKMRSGFRKTEQFILPLVKSGYDQGGYDMYPAFPLPAEQIFSGFDSLARRVKGSGRVILDGFVGILWDDLREELDASLKEAGIEPTWYDVRHHVKSAVEIERMIEPFLGGDDPLFGRRTSLELEAFFTPMTPPRPSDHPTPSSSPEGDLWGIQHPASGMTIYYGPGASLFSEEGFLIYIDLPKNELQYRARAGSVTNLGATVPDDPKAMYKRFYFVDWPVLNRHKQKIADRIDILMDGQRPDESTWMEGTEFREALHRMSRNVFRVRPWFEPGAWGGNWIKEHIPGVNPDVPNYAWSFELIVPENGLLFESSGNLLEASFDWLMYREAESVLGDCHGRYGTEFPIRFDFLDTFDGGNLSVQCHPQMDYIREEFGEHFTQEEAYYILDTKKDAVVNLGFRDDIHPGKFRDTLEVSAREGTPVNIPEFVQQVPAAKHDFFLIPPGTIHGSGTGNLVLEISTTPYIFTFKLYDWLRMDLDGKPRDLNIRRGFDNLNFERKGDVVKRELISDPVLLAEGPDWKHEHLPTHPEHSYEVHRYRFVTTVTIVTNGKCHVLSLVEGRSIRVETANGMVQRFNYAETFVVPAAAESYTLVNEGTGEAMVVVAFVK